MKKPMPIVQVTDGAWYELSDYLRDICCDCCMVHDMQYKVENGKILFRATVNRRETNRLRKKHRITVKQGD